MSKKNYSVARVVTHTQSTIGKCERHNERKNESYANMNVDTARCDMNVHFKGCGELTYNEQLNKLIAEKKVCMRGLKADAKVFDDMFETLFEQMKQTDGITEQLKEENQMEWVCRMQNIEARAREVVTTELIYI